MASLVQSPWLGMVALGDNTMTDPNKGNHLRWAFEPRLGFPDGGFDLYRRPHVGGALVCVTFQGLTVNQNLGKRTILGDVLLESIEDIKTVELVAASGAPEIDLRNRKPLTIWPREACHRTRISVVDVHPGGGTIQAIAYDRNIPVTRAKTKAGAGIQDLELVADRIERVVVRAVTSPMNGVLTRICYTTIAADAASSGWMRLNKTPICLPLSDPRYPAACTLPHQAQEWPTAQQRIPLQVGGKNIRAWYGPDPPKHHFSNLRNTLARIYNPSPDPLKTDDKSCLSPTDSESRPMFVHDPLGVVLLTSLDPYIARMVGLYWIDGAFYVNQGLQGPPAATVGTAYDYMVMAHYPERDETVVQWHDWDTEAASSITGQVFCGPLAYETPLPLPVVDHAIDWDIDDEQFHTVRALRIPDNPNNIGRPLRIKWLEPAQAVKLYVDVPAGARAFARAFFKGAEVAATLRPASENGPIRMLLVADAIDTVELEGSDLFLAKTAYYTEYLPGGDMSFVVYNVTLGGPPALPRPSGLSGESLPVLTRLDPQCDPVTGQMAGGLRWDITLTGDSSLSGGVVLYDIERQDLGNGNTAAAINPDNWRIAKLNLLVAPPSPGSECEPYEPLPGWPAERPYYIDVPPSDLPLSPQQRWYAYRIRGTDVFGRKSAYQELASVDLKDTIPPPPPADVRAKYLDPDDLTLAPDERDWTHPSSGPRHGLRVGWRWTENLQQQAPDAAQFRVYLKTGRLNVILGNVTQVGAADPQDNVLLSTDVAAKGLPAGDVAHAFRGEWLSQGLNLYEVIDSGSAGGFLTLTIHHEKWEPPAGQKKIKAPELQPLPVQGVFSLSVRPPKPLAGMITCVGSGPDEFDLLLVVDTNVCHSGTANELAGMKLRQGGRVWRITANTTGMGFTMELEARACDPAEPAQGQQFAVMRADGITPIMLDDGNLHWRDYRDLLHGNGRPNWQQRVHFEPCRVQPRAGITGVIDNGDGTSTITTDQSLHDDTGHYLGGELEMNIKVLNEEGKLEIHNATWPVIGHTTTGNNSQLGLRVLNYRRDRVTGVVELHRPLTGQFTYWPDIVIPISELRIPVGQPAAYAAIAVSTADDKMYAADPWPGGSQPGNEGRVSAPQIIVRPDRKAPPAWPAGDPLVQQWATPADFLGRSFFTLRWPKLAGSGSAGLRYQVGRALEDRGDPPSQDHYRLLTPEALRPEDAPDKEGPGHPTADPALMSYDDTLDGKSSSRYYYRVRAVTAAGTPGDWSDPIVLVACPDVVPPRAPVITKVLGGDRQITLRWAQNREPDLRGYRVYRADSREKAEDLRLMEEVPTETAPPASCAEHEHQGEMCWSDTGRPALVTFYYRVVAVDTSDNVSKPSPVVVGRAYDNSRPEPPTWCPAQPGELPDSLVLSWASRDPNLRCLVQRYDEDASTWRNAGGWLERGVYTCTDEKRATGVQYVYRLRVLDTAGKTNDMYNELTA